MLGEIAVRAATSRTRYDALWVTEQASSRNPGWHRTGDVGHLDDEGRLWVEGRLVHVDRLGGGRRSPRSGSSSGSRRWPRSQQAAVVGVGPAGTAQVGPRRGARRSRERGPLAPRDADRRGAARSCRAAAAVLVRERAAGRHPAQLQDRPPGAGRVGRGRAGRVGRDEGPGHRRERHARPGHGAGADRPG